MLLHAEWHSSSDKRLGHTAKYQDHMLKETTQDLLTSTWLLRLLFALLCVLCLTHNSSAQETGVKVRIAEITLFPEHLVEYKALLQEEAEASLRLEKGVIAIFPMFQQTDSTQLRILEIYKDEAAYQSHLKTAHFLKYKNGTLQMVKTLKLVEMDALDLDMAALIFKKWDAVASPEDQSVK